MTRNNQHYTQIWKHQRIGWQKKTNCLHTDKTTSICFGREKSLLALMNRKELIASETKYLGLLFDKNFSFKSHIGTIVRKMKTLGSIVSRIRKVISTNLLVKMYNAYIEPIITYGILIYGPASKINFQKKSFTTEKKSESSSKNENLITFRASWTIIWFWYQRSYMW